MAFNRLNSVKTPQDIRDTSLFIGPGGYYEVCRGYDFFNISIAGVMIFLNAIVGVMNFQWTNKLNTHKIYKIHTVLLSANC